MQKNTLLSKRNGLILLVLILAVLRFTNSNIPGLSGNTASSSVATVASAYEEQQDKVQVQGEGTVIKLLKDDLQGSRHQRFILQIADNHTILIAHNIDIAPRIPDLKKGDRISFHGEYAYNDKGGVVHWTHHDPKGTHPDGWLHHKEKIYQ